MCLCGWCYVGCGVEGGIGGEVRLREVGVGWYECHTYENYILDLSLTLAVGEEARC